MRTTEDIEEKRKRQMRVRSCVKKCIATLGTSYWDGVKELLDLLNESKRGHYHCDDMWYCCRACREDDHGLVEGEHLGEGFDTFGFHSSHKPGECTCGAAAWNDRVDVALEKWK